MHPAYSVIFFTAASGAGYGLLFFLGLLNAFGDLPQSRWVGLAGLAVALGLITFGLLASTFHLGHPERAWRAFSQWRSSWLSREGVAAVLTYVPAGLFGFGWVFLEATTGIWAAFGLIASLGALVTVYTTSMIYASLKAIPRWHQPLVSPVYLTLGGATGVMILDAILRLMGAPRPQVTVIALVLIVVAAIAKISYWRVIDRAPATSTAETATGLGTDGAKVRLLDPPHTSPNYLQKEMGYRLARKHATKLRRIAGVALFALPVLLEIFVMSIPGGGAMATLFAVLAVLSAALGVVIERWLFFAEAQHTVSLYYGEASV